MCTQYKFSPSAAEITRDVLGLTESFEGSGDSLFPLYSGYVVTEDETRKRALNTFQWGLIPPWAKDAKEGRKFVNARIETVHEKPIYRSAFKSRRCLVPATGWYEWKQGSQPKQKYFITPKDNTPFVFAGIWQYWKTKDDTQIGSYCFLTAEPQGHLGEIHNRMPLFILDPDHQTLWLDAANDSRDLLYDYACRGVMRLAVSPVTPKLDRPDQPTLF